MAPYPLHDIHKNSDRENNSLTAKYGLWNLYENSEKKEKNAIPNVT